MIGIPQAIITRAKTKLDTRKVELDALMGDLQKEKGKIAKLANRQLRAEVDAQKLSLEASKIKSQFSEKNTALNKATEENNKDLSLGKKMNQYVSRFKPGTKNKELLEEILKFLAVETARKNKSSVKPSDTVKRRPNHRSDEIKVGSVVKLRSGKEKGDVISLQGKNATVLFGAFKTRVKIEKLSLVK